MMENPDLQLQFQELQAQQQQKLMERRRKKEQTVKSKHSDSHQDPSGKFGVKDELDLKLAEPPSKGMGYLSEELVEHLNSQIREMKDENGRLYKLLSERDFEIRQLKKKSENNKNSVLDGPVTNETAASKIIELSKKVRELTAEKEAERSKLKQFQRKYHDLQLQLQSQQSEPASVMGSMISLRSNMSEISNTSNKKCDEPTAADMKAVQDRLRQTESRLTDFRNQCLSLRQELKVAHKVLSQEIGENVNMQSLLNETSNWRGRAQQIIGLQQKVDELKVQLESGEFGSAGLQEKAGSNLTSGRRRQEDKYREELKRIERERKEAQENMTTKVKTLEEENKSFKDKIDAAKARNKVLSNEIKGQKSQVQTLLKKSRNDDEFIDALMKQQNQLKQLLEDKSSQQGQQNMQAQVQLQQLAMKRQHDANIVGQLQAIAAEKEAQVKTLEMELETLRAGQTHNQNNVSSNSQDDESSYDLGQCVTVTATVDSRPQTGQSEDENLTSRTRVISQSSASTALPSSRVSSRAASAMIAQASVQLNTSELAELRYRCQELEVMGRATEVEKDKMKELVQVLQQRLAGETHKLSDAQTELQTQKRLAVELEKRLGRQSLESASKKKGNSQSAPVVITADEDDNEDTNEIRTKLEIQEDENAALKAALQRTLKAKEEDLKVYSTTLDQTKQVFLQALKQMKDKLAS